MCVVGWGTESTNFHTSFFFLSLSNSEYMLCYLVMCVFGEKGLFYALFCQYGKNYGVRGGDVIRV